MQQMFVGRSKRAELIGLFLATLELIKQFQIRAVQDSQGGEIRLELVPEQDKVDDAAVGPAVWTDPKTGKMQYEWPSEEIRQQVEQRSKNRAERLSNRQFGHDDDDVIILDGDDYEPDAASGDMPYEGDMEGEMEGDEELQNDSQDDQPLDE